MEPSRGKRRLTVDEQVRALSREDQAELHLAVHEGRAVARAELAPLAVHYAERWCARAGTIMYRAWWYYLLAGAGVLLLATSPVGWYGAALLGVCLGVLPLWSQPRARRAGESLLVNQRLVDGAGSDPG